MLSFSCPSCQKKLGIKPEHAGKKIKCPGCGNVAVSPTVIPADTPPPVPSAESISLDNSPTADMGNFDDLKRGSADIPQAKIVGHNPAFTDFLSPPLAADELGRLGKYRILSVIGHGGMGIVFKAEDSVLKRRVAIKAILPSLGANDQVRKRFQREARSMAAVEHDHIVRLYEVNEDRGVSYIAMEFLEGKSLDQRLNDGDDLPLAEVLQIGREVAEGLAAAHARGLIHRDIKPANIWLEKRPNGSRVKILDFGLARPDDDHSRITQSGAVLGTPAYMSPEQGRGEPVDFRCDLFSLGVVLYRISTGREPFAAQDALSTLMAIANETPPSPQLENFDLPAELSDLIMKLLEKDPARRYASAQEVGEELGEIAKQTRGEAVAIKTVSKPRPAKATISEDPTIDIPRLKKPNNSKLWLILGLVAAAVLACTLVPIGSILAWYFVR